MKARQLKTLKTDPELFSFFYDEMVVLKEFCATDKGIEFWLPGGQKVLRHL